MTRTRRRPSGWAGLVPWLTFPAAGRTSANGPSISPQIQAAGSVFGLAGPAPQSVSGSVALMAWWIARRGTKRGRRPMPGRATRRAGGLDPGGDVGLVEGPRGLQ